MLSFRTRSSAETPAKASPQSRIARTHHDEDALAALQSLDRGGKCCAAVTGNDEIDGSDHCLDPAPVLLIAISEHLRAAESPRCCSKSSDRSAAGY
jgi:hypothetical protein